MKKLLILTQTIDSRDPVLGFMHRWIAKFAAHWQSITVICLNQGEYDLPANVKVLSLGKETGPSRLKYLANFYRYIFKERDNYDKVFVHMNEEYVLLGGIIWRLMGKKISMWRNHHAGSLKTRLAIALSHVVFCTSKYSYTAPFKKTIIMPVGIDTEAFRKISEINKKPSSILFLARISPVKKPHVLIDALGILAKKNISFTAHIYGDPLPKDIGYYESLKKQVAESGMADKVSFHAGIPNTETPRVYSEHGIFVNLSSSGMYDKTIFEAMACETLSVASNLNLKGLIDVVFIFEEGNAADLATKLEKILKLADSDKVEFGCRLRELVVSKHSLSELSHKLEGVLAH